ncbi:MULTISPECIES: oxidoreductase [Streptomyces]|uniref:Oxidoreductase n=1 Tax=Streptomyces venezuelae TaxID=54571 RepID=A0A5P2B145_STRVZ|nr:oxidoreductase [Streptomyces venezuelae]QES22881.1 oxidoreductase [Streptomyces venezuelae]
MTFPPVPPYGYGYPPPPPRPGVIPLAPLTLGTILSGTFAAFGRHWKQLLGVTAAVYGTALLFVGAAIGIAYAAVSDLFPAVFDLPAGQEPRWDDVRPLIVAFVLVWVAALITIVCANALMAAACPAVIQEAVLGLPTRFGALWRRSWSRLPAVLGTVLLTSLALMLPYAIVLAGMVGMFLALFAADSSGTPDGSYLLLPFLAFLLALLVTPLALWIWVKFSLAPAAAVMEGQGAIASMRRSSALVRGFWWRTFGIMLLVAVATTLVSWLIQQLLSMLASAPIAAIDFSGGGESAVIAAFAVIFAFVLVGQLVSQLVVSVFPPLVTSLIYVDLRIRKENLAPDLARAAGFSPGPDMGQRADWGRRH